MKVKLTAEYQGANRVYPAGVVIDLPSKVALKLLDRNAALSVDVNATVTAHDAGALVDRLTPEQKSPRRPRRN